MASSGPQRGTKEAQWVVVGLPETGSAEQGRTLLDALAARHREGCALIVVPRAPKPVVGAFLSMSDVKEAAYSAAMRELMDALHGYAFAQLGLQPALVERLTAPDLTVLRTLVRGLLLTRRAMPSSQPLRAPRAAAELIAIGEAVCAKLVHAWLAEQSENVGWSPLWLDSRTAVVVENQPHSTMESQYLYAACDMHGHAEQRFLRRLRHIVSSSQTTSSKPPVVVMQSSTASADDEETVQLRYEGLLASYVAGWLHALRLEVWSAHKFAGFYTCNPRWHKEARLIRRVGYSESVELATMGASSIHPGCVPVLAYYHTPLHLFSIARPAQPLTVVDDRGGAEGEENDSSSSRSSRTPVKAISTKINVTVISMDDVSMWQQAGFLARVFAIFAQHGVSVGLVSTSETDVSITLDDVISHDAQRRLLHDLNTQCSATARYPCVAISLVGEGLGHRTDCLEPVLSVLRSRQVHIMSYASLSFTFVVDGDRHLAKQLVSRLHARLFADELRHGSGHGHAADGHAGESAGPPNGAISPIREESASSLQSGDVSSQRSGSSREAEEDRQDEDAVVRDRRVNVSD